MFILYVAGTYAHRKEHAHSVQRVCTVKFQVECALELQNNTWKKGD